MRPPAAWQPTVQIRSRPMRLMVFNVVGILLAVIAYAFSLGGTIAALIYLFVMFNGVLDRWAQPIFERIRP